MTLAQVEASLPNGFHDALLHSYTVDLVNRRTELRLEISVGLPDAPTQEERDAYRPAVLTLCGLVYFTVEPPDSRYPGTPPWCIDLSDSALTSEASCGLEQFAGRFYSSSTNSFLRFCAGSAELVYVDKAGTQIGGLP